MSVKTIVAISFAANLALTGAAFYVFRKPAETPVRDKAVVVADQAQKHSRKKEPEAIAHEILVTNEVSSGSEFNWRLLEARDYKIYIANLRTVGCPEETIRDIITAEVNKLYAGRIRALQNSNPMNQKYWESNRSTWSGARYQLQQIQVHALEKERGALLIELLGVDPNEEIKRESPYPDYYARNYQFLPEEKRDQVASIQMKYEQLKQEIYGNFGMLDEDDQNKVRELYKQQLAELGNILTPQELEEYDLRASSQAQQLRYNLDAFKPSEDEFRKIYAIQKAREDDLTHVFDEDDKEAREKRDQAVKETNEQIKNVLGDRYQLYTRSSDWNYKELVRIADRYDLPRENVDKVYDWKKEAETEANKIRSNQDLTSDQRKEVLKNLRDETEKNITEALGEKGWKRYKGQQGWWLNNISMERR